MPQRGSSSSSRRQRNLPAAAAATSAPSFENEEDTRPYALHDVAQRARRAAPPPPYDYTQQWWPVGFIKDLDQAAPQRFVLLGIPLVIWFSPPAAAAAVAAAAGSASAQGSGPALGTSEGDAGGWQVFADVCPHRLVPLSEGRVTAAGLLECPYHGWAFSGTGTCERIPQEGNLSTPRACATAFPCVVRQGLLFVKPTPLPKHPLGAADDVSSSSAAHASSSSSGHSEAGNASPPSEPPTIPEFDQQPGWLMQDTWRDVPFDFSSLLENVLDASHVPFTHHKSISNRNALGDYSMQLTQQVSPAGFAGLWATGPRGGAMGPQVTQFRAPCTMQHTINAVETRGYESMVVVYAVPIAPGKCRLLNRNAFRFVGGGWGAKVAAAVMQAVPGWAIHLGTQVPLEDDQIFLHLGEAEYVAARGQGKSAAQAYYMPSRADTYVTAFRRWLAQCGGGGPFGDVASAAYRSQLEPRLSREQLLDRFSQHTAGCAQCQQALKRVQLARRAAGWLCHIAGGLAVLTAAVAVAAAAVAVAGSSGGGGGGAAAAADIASTGVGRAALSLLLGALGSLANVASAGGAVLGAAGSGGAAAAAAAAAAGRLPVWLAAAGFGWLLDGQLEKLEGSFYHGDYPPPRNTDRD